MGTKPSAMDKYIKIQELGKKGTSGIVYLVQNIQSQFYYTIKFIESKQNTKLLQKESNQIFQLSNACVYITPIYESFLYETKMETFAFGSEIKTYWSVVTPYFEKGSLHQWIKQSKERESLTGKGPKEDESQIIEWMLQLIDGISALHNINFIHRDLKPSNILLDHKLQLKISDFGIGLNKKDIHSLMGSMGYYAPEVYAGERYGPSADVWSLGIILLDLLTLSFPSEIGFHNHVTDRMEFIPKHYLKNKWDTLLESIFVEDSKSRCTLIKLRSSILQLRDSLSPKSSSPLSIPTQLKAAKIDENKTSPIDLYKRIDELAATNNSNTFFVQEISTDTFYVMKLIESLTSNINTINLEELKKENDRILQELYHCHTICPIHESFLYEQHIEEEEDDLSPFAPQDEKIVSNLILDGLEYKKKVITKIKKLQYWCVITPYYKHGNLSQWIKNQKEKVALTEIEGLLLPSKKENEILIVDWILDLIDGIASIHELNIIHNNLKLNNIFIDSENHLQISDIGMNKIKEMDEITSDTGYYAPEVYLEDRCGPSTDLWSLGCIILDLLTLSETPEIETLNNRNNNKERIKLIPTEYSSKWEKIIDVLLEEDSKKRGTLIDVGISMLELRRSLSSSTAPPKDATPFRLSLYSQIMKFTDPVALS